ncbi:MAG: Hpt domain-containing protein, partial [Desulfovibrionaceae bacterium]|nr:Hpt domain-containing protein [Desulfovibrionaceae bacterium]
MSREEQNRLAFKEEALELLGELESSLLELETDPHDDEIINRVFRAMHTIKGSGAMFGFEDIATFTHEVETVFDLVRNGQMTVSKELLDLTLLARDHILAMLEGQDEHLGEQAERVITGLKILCPRLEETAPARSSEDREQPSDTDAPCPSTWRVRFI